MVTETDENYLKETYTLQLDHDYVTTSMLAACFGFSAATVTGTLKKLAGKQWVIYEPYKGVILTDAGRAIALKVIRSHRLIETYLATVLGLPWEKVHPEAEKLEHVLSEYLVNRIDEVLGYPSIDPHGAPIPSPDGVIRESARLRLVDLPKGVFAEIIEVWDRDPGLLSYLQKLKLLPKTSLEIIEIEPLDGLITINISGKNCVLGRNTASRIIVKQLNPGAKEFL